MDWKTILFFLISTILHKTNADDSQSCFPDDFKFGIGTSAYQIEGAWNQDGKSENIWDKFIHENASRITDETNGDVAGDSYHRFDEDLSLLKELQVSHYRFSLSWTRILPTGLANNINQAGIDYYNHIIDQLLSNNITPLITIYHWDLPQSFQKLGGLLNSEFSIWVKNFADVAFSNFGDRVKLWSPINEPIIVCKQAYEAGVYPPANGILGVDFYTCIHNVLKAHAAVYHLYDEVYRSQQQGSILYLASLTYYQPASENEEDIEAARRAMLYGVDYLLQPVLSSEGDYPQEIKDEIALKSKQQNFTSSRLPAFTDEQKAALRGSYDYFALNHYTLFNVSAANDNTQFAEPSLADDIHVVTTQDPTWNASPLTSIMRFTPWAMRGVLTYVRERFDNPQLFVTENGRSNAMISSLDDQDRVDYISAYLREILGAINDGSKILGYFYWTLFDAFEWNEGYSVTLGLYRLESNLSRTPRASAAHYARIARTKCIP